ncbi:hypothetical protein BH23PAT1_BH23PAT1_1750 [soil metagenome]
MDEDAIADLKQFIAATVSRQTSEISRRFDKVDSRFNTIETKIDDLSLSIGEAIDMSNQVNDE